MESALGWLGDIIRALLMLVPRLLIVRTTTEAVKWVYGTKVVLMTHENGLLGTGLHFWWPLVTEKDIVPIKRQTANLSQQYLCTKDGQTVGVAGILVYEVVDTVALLTHCYDYEETIRDLALAAIKRVVVNHDFAFLRDEPHETDKDLTRKLRADLQRFGIKTIRVTLSDFTEVTVLATWGIKLQGVASE